LTLQDYPIMELIDELRARSPKGFVLMMDEKDPEYSKEHDFRQHFGEDFDRCIVLLKYAEWYFNANYLQNQGFIDMDKEKDENNTPGI